MQARDAAVRRALPPGAVRRRAAFGLLDADGWWWATLKAFFWFLLIIFLEGYVPDRLYYFTVSPTVDLGYNAISPINFCAPTNKLLPCPAPAGAVVPWEGSPPDLALPQPRSAASVVTSGENLYLVGGRGAGGVATADAFSTFVGQGNLLGGWATGPALPQPRADAVTVLLSGLPYVIGGRDAAGNPTTTVFRGTVVEGKLTGWEEATDLALKVPLADAAGVATTKGIFIFGGRSTDGAPSTKVYEALVGTGSSAKLGAWAENTQLPLPEARADQTAVLTGNFVYVLGGNGPNGTSNSVFFLALGANGQPKVNPATNQPFGWGVSVAQSAAFALPEPRAKHTSFTNSGASYVLGGVAADGSLQKTNYWAVPDATTGALIGGWSHLAVTDLPDGIAEAAVANVASTAFVIGGDSAAGPTTGEVRANLAPARPFFRLGLFGVTVPALAIKGEIGQQLGYLVAGGVALGNFVVLVIIGIAYAHRRETRRFFAWITRGRYRPPPEDRDPAY
jgi:N-acetylneuraminic acid mutarotase